MTLGIFIYGVVVFGIVCGALGLLSWGILKESRDRSRFDQGSEVYGVEGARLEAKPEDRLRGEERG